MRPAPKRPWLSVIIPARNEREHLAAAVHSARADGAEILLADGASTDGTVALARELGLDVVRSEPHRARQQNAAARRARGDVLLFLHADTRLPPGYAEEVRRVLAQPRAVAGAFRFETELDSPAMRLVKRLVHLRCTILHAPYGDQAIFVRRDAFEAMGGFGDLEIGEDMALVARLKRRGRIVMSPAAAVTSDRRWREAGVLLTTAMNQLMLVGCWLDVPKRTLRRWYRALG